MKLSYRPFSANGSFSSYRGLVLLAASLAAATCLPVIVLRSLFGPAKPFDVIFGTLIATGFFSITGVAMIVTERQGFDSVFRAVLVSYITKISLLAVVLLWIPELSGADGDAFVCGTLAAAITFVAVELALMWAHLLPPG